MIRNQAKYISLSLVLAGLAACGSVEIHSDLGYYPPDRQVTPDVGRDMGIGVDHNNGVDAQADVNGIDRVVPADVPSPTDVIPPTDVPPTQSSCTSPVDLNATGTTANQTISVTGSTVGLTNNQTPTCAAMSTSPEVIYTYKAPSGTGTYRIVASTDNATTTFDTVVYARSTCAERFSEIGCDDNSGANGKSIATFKLAAGASVFIIVDGNSSGCAPPVGAFQLDVTATPIVAAGGQCDPAGLANVCDDGLGCVDDGAGGHVCQLTSTPILFRLRAVSYPNGTLRLIFDGSDADGNVSEGVFTAQDSVGGTINYPVNLGGAPISDQDAVFDPPGPGTATTFSATSTFPSWFSAIASNTFQVTAHLVDATNQNSNVVTVRVTPAEVRNPGEPCDPAGIDNVCAGKSQCTGTPAICVLPAAVGQACMAADAATHDLTAPFEDITTLTPSDPSVFEGSCPKFPGLAEKVYAVTVPAGMTNVDLAATTKFADEYVDSYIYIRRICDDNTSELACNDDINPSLGADADYATLVSVNDVSAGTYYVFADTSNPNGLDGNANPATNQPLHVKIYLRPVVATGAPCDPAQIQNRCGGGNTCRGATGNSTCQP